MLCLSATCLPNAEPRKRREQPVITHYRRVLATRRLVMREAAREDSQSSSSAGELNPSRLHSSSKARSDAATAALSSRVKSRWISPSGLSLQIVRRHLRSGVDRCCSACLTIFPRRSGSRSGSRDHSSTSTHLSSFGMSTLLSEGLCVISSPTDFAAVNRCSAAPADGRRPLPRGQPLLQPRRADGPVLQGLARRSDG
jgi:hypothetical protein